jgi:predicted DNA-binding transcriptional regulator AlpA
MDDAPAKQQPRKRVRISEVMERYSISRSTVYDWANRGLLRKPTPIVPGSRAVAFYEDELSQ